jgi:hypothetical protein
MEQFSCGGKDRMLKLNEFRKRMPLGVYDVLMYESSTPGIIEIYLTKDTAFQNENVKLLEGMPEVQKVRCKGKRGAIFEIILRQK